MVMAAPLREDPVFLAHMLKEVDELLLVPASQMNGRTDAAGIEVIGDLPLERSDGFRCVTCIHFVRQLTISFSQT